MSIMFADESIPQDGFSPSDVATDTAAPESEPEPPRVFSRRELCSAAVSAAEANKLPVPFFANLIQQESGFKPHAVSPAGAQGIAQFMPRVAAAYDLPDPFDPIRALHASGKFLSELRAQFGNLGLAAAAYNAGPKRVQDWMARRGKLPAETRKYVRNITGRTAEQWVRHRSAEAPPMPLFTRCREVREMMAQAIERDRNLRVGARAAASASKVVAAKPALVARAAVAARTSLAVKAAPAPKRAAVAVVKKGPAVTAIKKARLASR